MHLILNSLRSVLEVIISPGHVEGLVHRCRVQSRGERPTVQLDFIYVYLIARVYEDGSENERSVVVFVYKEYCSTIVTLNKEFIDFHNVTAEMRNSCDVTARSISNARYFI